MHLEPQSIAAIDEEVRSIRERFDDIVTILEARGSNIDVTLSQTDKYNIAYNEIAMLMDSAEGFILRQGQVADDLDNLQRQLSEQRVSVFFYCLTNVHFFRDYFV